MKLKAKDIDLDSNFSHYSERDRLACEQLQAKAKEFLALREPLRLNSGCTQDAALNPARYEGRHPDVLLNAAADALGNADERYSGIYACEKCGRLYHADYSTNSDPDHDYCGGDTCQPERSHRKYD